MSNNITDSTTFDNIPTKNKRGKPTPRVPQSSETGLARVVEITRWLGQEMLALQAAQNDEVQR